MLHIISNEPQCLICNNKLNKKNKSFPYSTEFENNKFNYYCCKQCHSVTINPIPSKKLLEKIYNQDEYYEKFYSDENNQEYIQSINFLKKKIKGKNCSILDFGCGNGHFIKILKEQNFKIQGVEFSKEQAHYLTNKLNTIVYEYQEFLEKTDLKYDVIHLGDVLEHLTNPADILQHIKKNLNKNGLLYIEGPLERNPSFVFFTISIFSFFKSFFKENNHVPYHLSFTNQKAQILFFNNLGLKISYWNIYETGWPYNNSKNIFKKLIAGLSVFLSKIPFLCNIIGNRFRTFLYIDSIQK